MELKEIKQISVIGAAGKMGSGITLLLTQLYLDLFVEKKISQLPVIYAIDLSRESLLGLRNYIGNQLKKTAEKKCVLLRKHYSSVKDLKENADFINRYVEDGLSILSQSLTLGSAMNSEIVFEAAIEDVDIKTSIFKKLKAMNKDVKIFTNTSSIPIKVLDEKAGLNGNIIGFHFYNPPAVQKLVEVISNDKTNEQLLSLSDEFISYLHKTKIKSNDVAGFIGNGFFMRDIINAFKLAEKLKERMPIIEAIYATDIITKQFLLRPMGIIQLSDYVGLDVCNFIMKVMNPYFEDEEIKCEYLEKFIECNIKGGQYSSGKQKDGIFKYNDKGAIEAVYDIDNQKYIPIESVEKNVKEFLGSAKIEITWKSLLRDKEKNDKIKSHFKDLRNSNSQGAQLAIEYLDNCKKISERLVETKATENYDDINAVMINGFYHLYGPQNNY